MSKVDTSKPGDFVMLGAGDLLVINAGAGEKWHSWWDKPRLYQKFLKKFVADRPHDMVAGILLRFALWGPS